jgi:thiol-disulfide isomerase/thioredoxin
MVLTNVAGGAIIEVSGRVVDHGGRPVAGARVAESWFAEQDAPIEPNQVLQTDSDGRFCFEIKHYGHDTIVTAIDASGSRGGFQVIHVKEPAPIRIELVPLVEVRGRFTCKESDASLGEMYETIFLAEENLRLVAGRSRAARFAFKVPPGRYVVRGGGSYRHVGAEREFTVAEGAPMDLGAIDLVLTPIARMFGKEAPPWHVTDARGVSKDVRPSDFKGKWIVLDFWGFWCGPCVARSLPGWIDFVEDHAADREKFEVLAFHDPQATNFAMLDDKLEPIIKRQWHGRPLPFPILLDTTGATVKTYGIDRWPTVILIDPEGRVVDVPQGLGLSVEDFLAAKLSPLPAEKKVARALDRGLSLDTGEGGTLAELIRFYDKMGRIRIHMDPVELKACGVDERTLVPVSAGGLLTLRAWLNFTLEPLGLTYVAQGEDLRIVRRTRDNRALSHPSPRQENQNRLVAEALKATVTFECRGESLNQLMQRLEAKSHETFVLDPVARYSGAIKPKMTVTGSAVDEPLSAVLTRLLAPLGMKYEIRDEAVVLTVGDR